MDQIRLREYALIKGFENASDWWASYQMMKDLGTIFEKGNNEGLSIYNWEITIFK